MVVLRHDFVQEKGFFTVFSFFKHIYDTGNSIDCGEAKLPYFLYSVPIIDDCANAYVVKRGQINYTN